MSKAASSPILAGLTRPVRRRPQCKCTSPSQITPRTITTTSARRNEDIYGNSGRELRHERRWESTPPRMTAPVRSKPPVQNNEFAVNRDPERLNRVYNRVLGQGGDKLLTDEVKWLAVTHKSFDHGKRGYNDRLAYLGKRIVELQTSLALIAGGSTTQTAPTTDQYGRETFVHPALQGLDSLSGHNKGIVTEKVRFAQLAEKYGLDTVLRWKPKRMTNLQGSGLPLVLNQALYAIIGAVALQRGGEVANSVVKERIFTPLGFR